MMNRSAVAQKSSRARLAAAMSLYAIPEPLARRSLSLCGFQILGRGYCRDWVVIGRLLNTETVREHLLAAAVWLSNAVSVPQCPPVLFGEALWHGRLLTCLVAMRSGDYIIEAIRTMF